MAQRVGRGIALPSVTAALEGGEWSVARTGRTLPQGTNRYPFYRRQKIIVGNVYCNALNIIERL